MISGTLFQLETHNYWDGLQKTAIKCREEENQPGVVGCGGELAFSMTIWHRRRRLGTKESWMERRGECAIALTCK